MTKNNATKRAEYVELLDDIIATKNALSEQINKLPTLLGSGSALKSWATRALCIDRYYPSKVSDLLDEVSEYIVFAGLYLFTNWPNDPTTKCIYCFDMSSEDCKKCEYL